MELHEQNIEIKNEKIYIAWSNILGTVNNTKQLSSQLKNYGDILLKKIHNVISHHGFHVAFHETMKFHVILAV